MATTADYLLQLERLRSNLAQNMIANGFDIDEGIDLSILIPLVVDSGFNFNLNLDKYLLGELTEYDDKEGKISSLYADAFNYQFLLTSVSFPNVTELRGGFYMCRSLVNINFPQLKNISYGGNLFMDCVSLKNVIFPALINLQYMGDVFQNCTNLKLLDLGTCEKIGSGMTSFCKNCTALDTLILRREDSICTLANSAYFTDTLISKGTGYIYVPKSLISEYQQATNWSVYAAQFRAIEDYQDICKKEVLQAA